MFLAAFPCFFRQVPGAAPVAAVGAEFHGHISGGDLVLGCGEGCTFGRVFAFAADWAFGGVVPRGAFREFPSSAMQIMPDSRAIGLRYYLGECVVEWVTCHEWSFVFDSGC